MVRHGGTACPQTPVPALKETDQRPSREYPPSPPSSLPPPTTGLASARAGSMRASSEATSLPMAARLTPKEAEGAVDEGDDPGAAGGEGGPKAATAAAAAAAAASSRARGGRGRGRDEEDDGAGQRGCGWEGPRGEATERRRVPSGFGTLPWACAAERARHAIAKGRGAPRGRLRPSTTGSCRGSPGRLPRTAGPRPARKLLILVLILGPLVSHAPPQVKERWVPTKRERSRGQVQRNGKCEGE